jgi:hypothetical protein
MAMETILLREAVRHNFITEINSLEEFRRDIGRCISLFLVPELYHEARSIGSVGSRINAAVVEAALKRMDDDEKNQNREK